MQASCRGTGFLSSIHMAGLVQATCKPPRDAAPPGSGHRHPGRCGVRNVPLYLGRAGGNLVLQGLMRKTAPAGQGEALLHQLRKHRPGRRLFIRHFKWEPEKRGGGEREKNQVHFCLYIFTKYIYLFTYERPFFFPRQ